jgi:glycosyltransferase involved in cell wall biosynthesis
VPPPASLSAGPRWRRLRQKAGPLGPAVAAVQRAYHRLKGRDGWVDPAEVESTLKAAGVSVLHFPFPQWFRTSIPFLYEPWDLQHRHYPGYFLPEEVKWRDECYRRGCEEAALVVTATRWVKDDIVRQFQIPARKIAVIPRGHRGGAAAAAASTRIPLPDDFALYPAMTFPHKNHVALLKALARLRDTCGIRLNVVCCGRPYPPHWPAVEEEVRRLRLHDQVRFLGEVAAGDLRALFVRAKFLVFPSLFEGLGFPLIEAFEAGLPVVAARSTCIPEVVGDAAILFDAASEDSIVETLKTVREDPRSLEVVASKGRSRLAAFAWADAARKFLACYRYAAGSPSAEDRTLVAEITLG